VGLFCAAEKHLFEHTDRLHPVYFQFPFERVDDITIELPSDWQIGNVPPPQKSDRGLAVYTSETTKEKGALKFHRTLSLDALFLDVKNYPALRHFFQEVRTLDEQQVLLQPPSASN
jgi:hypothetical protein